MSETLRAELYSSGIQLRAQPIAVPALLRTAWRVPVVLLTVHACRQRRAKREQLVVLNWALRDPNAHAALVAELAGEPPGRPVWVRYEPAMVRATNIAHGLGLLEPSGEWLQITDTGDKLLDTITTEGLYEPQRGALAALPRPLPLNVAERVLRGAAT